MKESGILEGLDPGERRLQEALFEIVSSETSYLKSLNMDRRLKQLRYYLPRINWRSHKVGKIKIVKLIIFRQSSASFSAALQDLENGQVDVSLNVAQMHKLTDMQKYK